MNRDAGDLWEFFFYAESQFAGAVMDLCDGERAVHGAVAGDQDFLLDLAHKAVSQRFLALRRRILLCIITSKATHLGRCVHDQGGINANESLA
jgi:hypothetical protein